MRRIAIAAVLSGVVLLGLGARAEAPPPLPYSEGTVWELTMIRLKPGFGDDYFRSLSATWKKMLDEAKKQKLVVSYKVLATDAANRDDWDLLLMVEYKNMAAFDGLEEKMRAIEMPVMGGEKGEKELMTKRIEVREILGGKLARELLLK